MPSFYKIIDESITQMIQPISEQLIQKLFKTLGIWDTIKDSIYYNSPGSAASQTSDKNHRPKLTTNRVDIEVVPNFNSADVKWPMTTSKYTPAYGTSLFDKHENHSLFIDKRANIYLQEQLVPCSVNLNIQFSFKYKELAYQVLDAIYSRHYTGSIIEYNDIYYSYPFPIAIFKILHILYNMKEFDIDMTFAKYLKYGSNDNVSYLKSRNKDNTQIIIQKNQFRVLSELLTSVEQPDSQKINKLPDVWNIPISFYYQFSRPNTLALYYPTTIENKLIPVEICPQVEPYHPTDIEGVNVDVVMQQYISKQYTKKYVQHIVRYPAFDDWEIPTYNNNMHNNPYKHFFIGTLLLDPTSPEGEQISKIDLINELPNDSKLHPILIETLKLQGRASFNTDALFNISVYANDVQVDPSLLDIDQDLVVYVKSTIKHKRYHIVLSELLDIKNLNSRYTPILIKYDNFFASTIIRQLDILKEKGDIYIDNGLVYPNRDKYTPTNAVKYEDLDGYEEIEDKQLLVTKANRPLLEGQGGTNGFSYPFRVGRYTITTR
jgi:hypothetical protein